MAHYVEPGERDIMPAELTSPTEELKERWPVFLRAQRTKRFRELHSGEKADFYLDLSAHDQTDLLLDLPPEQRHVWIRLLAPDNAVDVIQEAGDRWRNELLQLLDEPTRREVVAQMAYEEGMDARVVVAIQSSTIL